MVIDDDSEPLAVPELLDEDESALSTLLVVEAVVAVVVPIEPS